MYHYAGNNPVRYIDPDGRFSAIYKLEKIFQKDWNANIRKYNEMSSINKLAMESGFPAQELSNPFEKTITENTNKYMTLIYDWANYYAQELLGYDDYSEEQKSYTLEEVGLFQAIQNYRTSKNDDGSYKTKDVDDLIKNAIKEYKKVYEESLKNEGLSKRESIIKAETETNNFLKDELKKAGYYE